MSEYGVKSLPLQGLSILVTRTHEQAGTFSQQLSALGAIPVEFPIIRVVPPEDWEPLDNALRRLCEAVWYDWLVFTSANGVRICFERLQRLGYGARSLGDVRVATIGPATAEVLAKYGVAVDLVPAEYIAEGIAVSLLDDARKRGESLKGKKVLLARAAEARSSTVRNFMHWIIQCDRDVANSFLSNVSRHTRPKIACIGPITSQMAREFGLDVHIEAQEYTIAGLIEAIIRNEEKS